MRKKTTKNRERKHMAGKKAGNLPEISDLARAMAHLRWEGMSPAERSRANEPGRRGVINWWKKLSPEQRSEELRRRAVTRTINARLRAEGIDPKEARRQKRH